MRAVAAIFVLATLAPAVAVGQQPTSPVARAVAGLEASLRKRIAATPTDPSAYLDLASLQEEFDASADAEVTLVRARQALPANKDVAVRLAGVYGRQEQFEKAMTILDSVAQRDPADAEIQETIAAWYYDKAYKDKTLEPAKRLTYIAKGIDATDRALAIRPDIIEVLVYKGSLLKLRAEITTDPAQRTRIATEADALLKRASALRAK
jgi:tetratricopeptide (TPR) repeat protein